MAMARSVPKRLGILGGTFDPVHPGHLAVARTALAGLGLDQVLFLPSSKPPHKTVSAVAPFSHRLAMLRLALAECGHFQVSALEGERQAISYTIDTLQELRKRLPVPTELFFLMGFDAFVEMASWKRYAEIPSLADLVVINRPQARQGSMAAAVQAVFGRQAVSAVVKPGQWLLAGGGRIHELVMAEVPLSSTAIRQALAQGGEVATMLHPAVAAYIRQHGLYRARAGGLH
jgi:nicotinate-nucleotide adenylyltransferase